MTHETASQLQPVLLFKDNKRKWEKEVKRESKRKAETTRGCGARDRHTLWFSVLQCRNPPTLKNSPLGVFKRKEAYEKVQRMPSKGVEATDCGSFKPMFKNLPTASLLSKKDKQHSNKTEQTPTNQSKVYRLNLDC